MPRYTEAQYAIAEQIVEIIMGHASWGEAVTNLSNAITARSPILEDRLRMALREFDNSTSQEAKREAGELLRQFWAQSEDDDARTESVRLRLSPSEKRNLEGGASDEGLTVAAFIRKRCDL